MKRYNVAVFIQGTLQVTLNALLGDTALEACEIGERLFLDAFPRYAKSVVCYEAKKV